MKTKFTLFFLLTLSLVNAQVPSFATKKSLGNNMTARKDPSMVAINNKLYIYGGYSGTYPEDFSEYDPTSGAIVKLMPKKYDSRAGRDVFLATAHNKIFAIGNTTITEYDFVTKKWLPTVNLTTPSGFDAAKSFVINNDIYIISKTLNILYCYNISTRRGIQKASIPLDAGYTIPGMDLFTFVINGKGYAGGTPISPKNNTSYMGKFYEYNPEVNTWTIKADIPAVVINGIGVSVNGRGYAGTGFSYNANNQRHKSYYWFEYIPSLDVWYEKQDFMNLSDPLTMVNRGRANASGASIGTDIYLFGGLAPSTGYNDSSDRYEDGLYKYDTTIDAWFIINEELGKNRTSASGFSYNGKIYVGGGQDNESLNDFWEYNPDINNWTQKADLPSIYYERATGEIGGKGYFVGGFSRDVDPNNIISNSKITDELIQYDPLINIWTTKLPYPGGKRTGMTAFVYNNMLYAGFGNGPSVFGNSNSFYQYDPILNSWAEKSPAPFSGSNLSSFVLGNIGYVISYYPNLIGKYNFNANTWTTETHNLQYNDQDRNNFAFTFNGNGYALVKGGSTDILTRYNPSNGSWTQVTNLPFKNRSQTIITSNNGIYLAFGAPGQEHPQRIAHSNDLNLLKFNASASSEYGNFQSKVHWSMDEPFLCGTGNLSPGASHSVYDNKGDLLSTLIAGSTGIVGPCFKITSKDLSIPFLTETRNFGRSIIETGMYLNKSLYHSDSSNDGLSTLRLYYTSVELNKLVSDFNLKYSTNKTITDIKLVVCRYNGIEDDNPLNNTVGTYSILNTSINTYGLDKYFDVNGGYLNVERKELYVVLLAGQNLSNEEFSSSKISIYPNPTKNILNISLDDKTTIDSIIITDLLGKKIIEQTNNPTTVNIEKLAKGVYVLEIYIDDKKETKKFIKE